MADTSEVPIKGSGPSSGSSPRPLLLTPLKLRSLSLRNKIVTSPMCQYASVDGSPTDWQLVQFGRFAIAGAGVVFGEETAIEADGRKTYDCAGLYHSGHVSAYKRIADFIRQHGAAPAIQLGHSGRKGSCHGALRDWAPLSPRDAAIGLKPWRTIAPSPIAVSPLAEAPKEMDRNDIATHLDKWRIATLRSAEIGYDILEIHAAHGYLLHQFLSPVTNRRQDAYGGDRAGRMRLTLETTEVVRAAWPSEKPLFVRISAVDGAKGIWNVEDTIALAKELKLRGVDVVDVSSGGISGDSDMPSVPRIPGYHVGFSEKIRREADIATMAVGLITEPKQAEDILQSGKADLIALARELLWNPNWPLHAASVLLGRFAHEMLPVQIAQRLQRREDVAKLMRRPDGNVSSAETALIETT